jgi:hypothetical protein
MNKTVNTVAPVISAELLQRAATLAAEIETKREELNLMLAGTAFVASTPVKVVGKKGKRVLSPEAKAAIVEGQKRRWRKVHKAEKEAARATPIVVTPPPNGTLEVATGFPTPPLEPTA